jgi:hypothetical protein
MPRLPHSGLPITGRGPLRKTHVVVPPGEHGGHRVKGYEYERGRGKGASADDELRALANALESLSPGESHTHRGVTVTKTGYNDAQRHYKIEGGGAEKHEVHTKHSRTVADRVDKIAARQG